MTKLMAKIAHKLTKVIKEKKTAEALAAIKFIVSKIPEGGCFDDMISNGPLLFNLALQYDEEKIAERLFEHYQNKERLLDVVGIKGRSSIWFAAKQGYIQYGLCPGQPRVGLLYDLVQLSKRRFALDNQASKLWLQPDNEGRTPLHCAVEKGSVLAVKFLLGEILREPNYVDLINKGDIQNNTPLHLACYSQGLDIIIANLINAGCDLSHVQNWLQVTPFERLYRLPAIRLRNIYDLLDPIHRRTLSRLYTNQLNQQATPKTQEQLDTKDHFRLGFQNDELMLEVDQATNARYRLANEGSLKLQMIIMLFEGAYDEFSRESHESYFQMNRYIVLHFALMALLFGVLAGIAYIAINEVVSISEKIANNYDYLRAVGEVAAIIFVLTGIVELSTQYMKANVTYFSYLNLPPILDGYINRLNGRSMRPKIVHPSRWELLVTPLNEEIIPALQTLEQQHAAHLSTVRILGALQVNVANTRRDMPATAAKVLCSTIKSDLQELKKVVILNQIPWPSPLPPHVVIEMDVDDSDEHSALLAAPALSINHGYGAV